MSCLNQSDSVLCDDLMNITIPGVLCEDGYYLCERQRRTALLFRVFGVKRQWQDLFTGLAFLHHPLPHLQALPLPGVGAGVARAQVREWRCRCARVHRRPGATQRQEGWKRGPLERGCFPEQIRRVTQKVRTHFNHAHWSPDRFVRSVTGELEIWNRRRAHGKVLGDVPRERAKRSSQSHERDQTKSAHLSQETKKKKKKQHEGFSKIKHWIKI